MLDSKNEQSAGPSLGETIEPEVCPYIAMTNDPTDRYVKPVPPVDGSAMHVQKGSESIRRLLPCTFDIVLTVYHHNT